MFFGIGAYGVALALYALGASWGALALGLAAAAALSLALALAIGLFSLRVQSIFFAMVTLAVAYAFNVLASQLSWLTGGEDGRSFQVPERPAARLQAGRRQGLRRRDHRQHAELLSRVRRRRDRSFSCCCASSIRRSGASCRRSARTRSAPRRWAIASSSIARSRPASRRSARRSRARLIALWLRYVGPDTALCFSIQIDVLVIVVIGGMGSLYGAIIGAALFVIAENYLQALIGRALAPSRPTRSLPLLPACSIPTAGCSGSASRSCWRSISPRPALSARSGPTRRNGADAHGLRLVQHQDRWARFGLNLRLKSKTGLLIGAPCASIVDRWIDRNQRRAFGAEPRCEPSEIRLPMAAPDHRRPADETVDRP